MKKILALIFVLAMAAALPVRAASGDKIPDYIRIYIDGKSVKESKKIDLMQKSTLKLTARTFPSSASKSVKWYSNDESIASVTSSGTVTAHKVGECRIYVCSKVKSSIKTYIMLNVTRYMRRPDKISVEPEKGAVFKTGNTVGFNVRFYPDDTTERRIKWSVSGGNASISQSGKVTIYNRGTVRVRAYADSADCFSEYTFEATYGDSHFKEIGECFNILESRSIVFSFDEEISAPSVQGNIFASTAPDGNGAEIKLKTECSGGLIKVSPETVWIKGINYIFVCENLSDKNGNKLGENLKYKINVR